MKIVHLGMITTGTVIALGIGMLLPAFTQHGTGQNRAIVTMLSFSITNGTNANSYCEDLSSLLEREGLPATVFVTGQVAETNPGCVRSFPSYVDIGSMTYSHTELVNLENYTEGLDQVSRGKQAIDSVGNLESLVFKAPYGRTDENIYSFLSRSGIIADFSYVNSYNLYENEIFAKYDLKSIRADEQGLELFHIMSDDADVSSSQVAIELNFSDSVSIDEVSRSISILKSYSDIRFVNASELSGKDLTIRMD